MRKYLTLFTYVSLLFLVIALFKADYLFVPTIYFPGKLLLSLGLLFLGFFADAIAWHRTVVISGNPSISLSHAISSMGLSVFGKYIPGKFWVVLGRAGFLIEQYGLNKKDTAALSLNAQFISLWVGLLLGGIGILLIGDEKWYGTGGLVLWAFLTILLFSHLPHQFFRHALKTLFKKDISLPFLTIKSIIGVIPWYLINWLLWIASFYFFTDALTITDVNMLTGFTFAIGATLGILVLFAPGGIGVREGVLFVFLVSCGLAAPEATTVAVSSRLWFLVGELFVFLLGLGLARKN